MPNESCLSEYAVLAALHSQLQRLMDSTDQRVRELGLQRTKFRLLIALKQQSSGAPATIGSLVDALQSDRATVVGLVDELVRQRFVTRERDRSDRRRFVISLTPAGEGWLKPLVEGDLRELAAAGPGLLRTLRLALTHAVAMAGRPAPAPPDVSDFAWRAIGTPI